jgi:hypothetical protein
VPLIEIHRHFHGLSADDRQRLRMLSQSVAVIRETIDMTISPQIQKAIDGIRQTQDLVKAVADADKVQTEQIGTLTAKVAELQAKLDAGAAISAEDLAGIAEITSDIDMVNAQLKTAIPANTDQGTAPTDTGVQTPAPNPEPLSPEPTADEIADRGDEASQAPQPLPGTGG